MKLLEKLKKIKIGPVKAADYLNKDVLRNVIYLTIADPGLAKLCEEVFGETELVYSKPATRLRGHLAGYDPQKAPSLQWPERLAKIGDQIRNDAVAQHRKKAASRAASPGDSPAGSPENESRSIEGWVVTINQRLLKDDRQATERAVYVATPIACSKLSR